MWFIKYTLLGCKHTLFLALFDALAVPIICINKISQNKILDVLEVRFCLDYKIERDVSDSMKFETGLKEVLLETQVNGCSFTRLL